MSEDSKILDFQTKRKENIEKKRRSFERVLFHNFLGAYTAIDTDNSVFAVQLIDISQEGCLFQAPWVPGKDAKFQKGEEIRMRMYFTKSSYIPVIAHIRYGKEFVDHNGHSFMHYGCEFDTSMPAFAAMEHFIEFLYSFAEHSLIDRGDARVMF